MSVLIWIFAVLLLYVSYIKIVGLLFRGKQKNRFFGFFLSTVVPVFGSIPSYILATKYERRVGGFAPKMNGYALRCIIIAMQMISVFMLFFPFFKTAGIYADGINLLIGLDVDGEPIFRQTNWLSYLIIAPFFSAIINAVDVRHNIHNALTYVVALVCALTVSLVALFVNTDGSLAPTYLLWCYCILNVLIMLFSIFSLVNIRNRRLSILEAEEETIYNAESQQRFDSSEVVSDDMYKCAKCGNLVKKGTVCKCRNALDTLDKVMERENQKESSKICVYCRRTLQKGEKCNCMGDGFGISVKTEQYEGRKCKYCGQILVGDSTCVCEKIMNKSAPISEDAKPQTYFVHNAEESMEKISGEMDELERKINSRFSKVKSSISSEQ